MEQYIEALKELNIQLRDTIDEQKQLIDKLKWVVNYFGDIIIEEKSQEQNLPDELDDAREKDEKIYETEKLSEEELEGDLPR